MRHLSLAAFALAALALAGCADDRLEHPAGPDAPPPDLSYIGFRLTIDVASGQVTVARPATPSTAGGPSLSLLGADVVGIQATSCTFSAIPGNTKLKRCTMQLSVTNRLDGVALVRPRFPTPPAGTNGILLFPFTASAQTITGSTAVANADWDNGPANFFNDFASCAGGKASDCYRSETLSGPLLPGETSEVRTVGFDVPKAVQNASTFVVVAADLGRMLALAPTDDRCGTIRSRPTNNGSDVVTVSAPFGISAGRHEDQNSQQVETSKGFCGFALGGLPASATVLSISLRLAQNGVSGTPYSDGSVLADHMDLGTELDADDFDASALSALGTLSTDADLEYKALDVTAAVLADVTASRAFSDFRVVLSNANEESVRFDGPAGANPPQLLVAYTE